MERKFLTVLVSLWMMLLVDEVLVIGAYGTLYDADFIIYRKQRMDKHTFL